MIKSSKLNMIKVQLQHYKNTRTIHKSYNLLICWNLGIISTHNILCEISTTLKAGAILKFVMIYLFLTSHPAVYLIDIATVVVPVLDTYQLKVKPKFLFLACCLLGERGGGGSEPMRTLVYK